jgi:ABC-2 type transport system ATP-binding protein
MLKLRGVVAGYGGGDVLQGVDIDVDQGSVVCIVGPNGAGKSTTVEAIAGLRRPEAGSIRVFGLDPVADGPELRRRVGVQLQESRFADRIRVGEVLDLFASFYRDPAPVDDLLDELGLTDHRRQRFVKLSGGLRQRLSIAVALVGDPEIAILDELTTGLDPVARRETWELIERLRRRGLTILLVTHFMEEAERLADRVALIDSGRLVAVDTPAGLVTRAGPEQRITFVPSAPVHPAVLTRLEEVTSVEAAGDRIVVTGTGDLLTVVVTELSRAGIAAQGLHADRTTLDDAFVALTGNRLDTVDQD